MVSESADRVRQKGGAQVSIKETSSLAPCCRDGEPARSDIPHWRLAEESAVLPIELACTFIANLEGCACGIQTFIEHAFSCYMQSKLLLVLKRAHRSQRPEMMVQG
jgi:hypothetical protein